MGAQVSREHHTVPKLYLRGFCGTKGADTGVLMARYRNSREEPLKIKEATAKLDFYDLGERTAPDDALEHWFDRSIENPVGELMAELRKGKLPTSAPAQETLARFVAAQMVRTISFRHLQKDLSTHLGPFLFANEVLKIAIDKDPSLQEPGRDLTALHAQISSHAPEIVRHPSKRSMMRSMVREADRLKPRLTSMQWILSSSDEPMLITGDTPVVTISGTGEILFTPMLLPDMHEVQLPITPRHLLTITPFPSLAPATKLTREQATAVNQAIARACFDTVLRHPDMPWPPHLILAKARTPLAAPATKVTTNGGQSGKLPTWPTVVDCAMTEALQLLGGDPDLGSL